MEKKLRRAWQVFNVACNAKHEARNFKENLETMKRGADEGLEIAETINHAIGGTFDLDDATVLGFKGINWAPRIDPTLRRMRPWRWWHKD